MTLIVGEVTSSDVGIANSDVVPVKELVVQDSDGDKPAIWPHEELCI